MNKNEILKRLLEIKGELAKEGADVTVLETETRTLQDKLGEIEKREMLIAEINSQEGKEIEAPKTTEKESEKRGKKLIEGRAVTIGSGEIVVPKHTATTVEGTFQQVSSLVDMVDNVSLNGGESYEVGYEKLTEDGDYTLEGANYKESEVKFGYAKIEKTKITAYSEESEEVQKLAVADYDSLIMAGVGRSIRKKLSKEMLIGDGTAGHFTGIFSTTATAIDPATDLEIADVDANTLDEIIYSYGGEEAVEGSSAVLVLNKKDLAAFAKVKGADKRKAYDIVLNGATGSINSIPFVINSACKALSDANTASGDYCMAYGYLSNYKLTLFSPMDVQRSNDFKFRQGMLAHRGSIFAGGNVVSFNGFIRVKKKASA